MNDHRSAGGNHRREQNPAYGLLWPLIYGSRAFVQLPFFIDKVTMQAERSRCWQTIVSQVAEEYRQLPEDEKGWIEQQLREIASLQHELDRLFAKAGGTNACGNCSGECCAKGHNHMTLANLLAFLQQGEVPPAADFSRTCPFLGECGCLLGVAERPYNCISFVCDIIENSLTSAEVDLFYQQEQKLRDLYLKFAERYVGGGLTGLLLQWQRLAGRKFLERKPAV